MSRFLIIILMAVMLVFTACESKDEDFNTEATKAPEIVTTKKPQPLATDPSWAKESVFYEIFVRSFCDSDGDGIGDFNGVAQKLPYLKELGVDAIWLMPMMEASKYHGYDVVDYYAVEADYGTMEDFENLVKACHDNDMKIIIDFVVNHSSYYNEWFQDAIKNDDSRYRDFYTIYNSVEELPENMGGIRADKETGKFFYGNYDFWMPDFNYHNQEVRETIKEVAGFWLDKGIDGFRLDGSKEIDKDMNITHEWWQEFSEYVKSVNPAAFIVGENWYGNCGQIAPFYKDMTSSFNFQLNYSVENIFKGAEVDLVMLQNTAMELYNKAAAEEGSVVDVVVDSTIIGNHDLNRIAARAQSVEKAKLAAAIQFTLSGTPFIYYGDELGQLSSSIDLTKREAFDWYKDGIGEGMVDNTTAFGVDGKYTIPADGISLEEQKDTPNSIYNYYKKLIAIRKENPVMFYGTYANGIWEDGMYSYDITGVSDGSKIVVAHNCKEAEASYTVAADGIELLTGKEVKAGDVIILKGYESLIVKGK